MHITKVISGGQTGADRGALDGALAAGWPIGGRCPAGRRAEGGPIPGHYPLEPTTSADYRVRTALNVEGSDGTLLLLSAALGQTPGTELTIACCEEVSKPYLVGYFHPRADGAPTLGEVELARDARAWAVANNIGVLNVAGPRESKAPGMQLAAMRVVYWMLTGA